jgi:hypothetical protein
MSDAIVTLDALYPDSAFFCARTTHEMMRWNVANADALPQYRLDATPAQLIGFAGAMPFVAHEAAATALAMDFATYCGLPRAQHVLTYRTEHDAADQAQRLVASGGKLVHNFGTLPGLEQDDGLLVSTGDYLRLNSKASLDVFVDRQHLPERRVVRVPELETCLAADAFRPVFIKIAEDVSTGGGAGVWHCADVASIAGIVEAIKARMDADAQVVVEADCNPAHSWCSGVSILDDGVIWLGASRQTFHSPARQSGNEMSGHAPETIKALALDISNRARNTGYRGIAGFDIGEVEDAEPVVFDLNFRPNSSTGLLLAGEAAMRRTGLPLARTFFLRHDGPLAELLDAVGPEADAGRIIPGSVFDADTYKASSEDAATRSCLDGWILAETRDQAAAYAQQVTARLRS